ncbi:MAG: 2-hydroxyacyl-CoA dehydratase [Deltaproteobacteria bacterium]|nr:2-hydroxyacyl-CoA dehydratase [Deltaproteobacteria bacterium]
MTPFEIIQTHYCRRDLAARAWKQKGGKVVGYFCDNVPEELIQAAGFFPYRLSGDPTGTVEIAEKYPPTGTMAAPREGFVNSMFNRLMTGEYDFLDFLVVPHARETIHRLHQVLAEIKDQNPSFHLPELYFLDNLHTTFYWSGVYNRLRWREFKTTLEQWSGKEITDMALSDAIAVTNENRTLLKKIAALRAADPPRISGTQALRIIGSSMFMLKEEHNRRLSQFLDELDKLSAKDGVRVFVEASPLDHLQLYDIIESCGAIVVGEDHCWGNRYSDVLINTAGDPFEALADRYHNKSPCPRMFPLSRRIDYCVNSAVSAGAQGAIINVYEFDEALMWEIPDAVKALEEKGIPSLHLRNQPYRIADPDLLTSRIREFIKSI